MKSILALYSALLWGALGVAPLHAAAAAASFEDASNVLGRSGHPSVAAVGGFAASQERLAVQFNAVCGDTFCAGDFSNLQPLSLTCSVDRATEQVGQCVWAFAGSYSAVDRATGKVNLHKQVFECDLGFKGGVADLDAFLAEAAAGGAAGDEGLRGVKIPGTDRSLMDVLVKCL